MILISLKLIFDGKGWVYDENLSITMPKLEMLFQKVEYKIQCMRGGESKNRTQVLS